MIRQLVVACAVAAAIGGWAAVAEAQVTCTGTVVDVTLVTPSAIDFGQATDADLLGPPGYVEATVTVTTASVPGNRTIKLCVRSPDPNMGSSAPLGYVKPLTDLRVGPTGAPIPVSAAYQFVQQQSVHNSGATFTLAVRVQVSYANDWPGNYLAHLEFGAWR